ncbi:Rop family plasmid primer RNA-binding protein [Candidatus Sodalis sp. SoCistrobi]|nr:Rop family plasmid primer RNA-binding protein [Candidatus Sodalis sp. SoCistrobi]
MDKLDQLDLDSCADECEELHELAEELYLHLRNALEK